MPAKTRPAHLRQHPSVLEQAVALGRQLGCVSQWPFRGEPWHQPVVRRLGRGGVCPSRHETSRAGASRALAEQVDGAHVRVLAACALLDARGLRRDQAEHRLKAPGSHGDILPSSRYNVNLTPAEPPTGAWLGSTVACSRNTCIWTTFQRTTTADGGSPRRHSGRAGSSTRSALRCSL